MTPRDYQTRACDAVREQWQAGRRAVCLVAPTGSGKTEMGLELCRGERVLWVVHTRALLDQTAERLRAAGFDAAPCAAGHEYRENAAIQVATVQTLLARQLRPEATVVVLDECHHYAATTWAELPEHYREARTVGLTATPQRRDGTALGDIFDALVVAAKYSELIRDGHLVQCAVYQPDSIVSGGLAQTPLGAWRSCADGQRAFLFAPRVALARKHADEFSAAGVPSVTVSAHDTHRERATMLDRFRSGEATIASNVYCLTEGVDVPDASCAILARGVTHPSPYLQMVGRILRPAPGKEQATLIDLTGATHLHGLPTADRLYSLDGRAIELEQSMPLKNCLQCGATINAAYEMCPQCGYVFVARELKHRIYSMELKKVFAGASTPDDAKGRELSRLRSLAADRGWSLGWVVREYRKLFSEAPVLVDVSEDEQRRELYRLRELQLARGYKPGFVAVRFRGTFGRWPPRHL